MNRFWTVGIAALAGVAVISLVNAAAVIIAALPGLKGFLKWLRANELPVELFNPGLLTLIPVVAVALLVGLLVFRLPGSRTVLFLSAAAPYVFYSLYINIGMLIWAGSSFDAAVTYPLAWLVASMAPLGLLIALGVTRPRSGA
jgi:hypothetical protein